MDNISIAVAVDLAGLEQFRKVIDDGLTHKADNHISAAYKKWGFRYRSFVWERFDKFSKGGGDWAPLKRRTILRRRDIKKKYDALKKRARKSKGKFKFSVTVRKGKKGEKAGHVVTFTQLPSRGLFERLLSKKKVKKGEVKKKKVIGRPMKVSILRDTNTLFNALSPTFTGRPGALQENIPFGIRVGYGGPANHPKGRATIADIARFHNDGEGYLPKREIIVAPPGEVIIAMSGDMQLAVDRIARDTNEYERNKLNPPMGGDGQ